MQFLTVGAVTFWNNHVPQTQLLICKKSPIAEMVVSSTQSLSNILVI